MPDSTIPAQPSVSGTYTANPVNISAFVELADIIQDASFLDDLDDTHFYLASTLYRSLENFAAALGADELPTRDRVYWFAYESFHLANALNQLCTEKPEGLADMVSAIKRVMELHHADYVEVSA